MMSQISFNSSCSLPACASAWLHALNACSERFKRRSSLLTAPSRAEFEGMGEEKPLEVGKEGLEDDGEMADGSPAPDLAPGPFGPEFSVALATSAGSFR